MKDEKQVKEDDKKGPLNDGKGPRYQIDIEGSLFPWDKDTITTEELMALAGLSANDGIIEIDMKEGTETSLHPGQVVTLKPGQGFSKKVKFKRGHHVN